MTLKWYLLTVFIISSIYFIYSPKRHAEHYDYIDVDEVYNELILLEHNQKSQKLNSCTYDDIIRLNTEFETDDIYERKHYISPAQGGEFAPSRCIALIKTAVIVPYRHRIQHLNVFVNYMHDFLQRQNIIYRIFIVNQNDSLPFNRAKMLNYGAKVAIDMGFNCLILHDVDLIPMNIGNIYGCAKKPRHMSSSIDTFRFNLPYVGLFGGVVAINSEQYKLVNGMSNEYSGWGGEDDDLFRRLEANQLQPYRFAPTISKYTMLAHKKEKASEERYNKLANSITRYKVDGLCSLPTNYSIHLKDLYTLINAS